MHPGHELNETDPPGEHGDVTLTQTDFGEYVPPPLEFSDIVSPSQLENGALFSSLRKEAKGVRTRPRNIEAARTSAHGTTESLAPRSALPQCDKSGLENPEILPAPPGLAVQGPDLATGMTTTAAAVTAPTGVDRTGESGTDGLTALPPTPARVLARVNAKRPGNAHADALLPFSGIATQDPAGTSSADAVGTHRRCEASRATRCRRPMGNTDEKHAQRHTGHREPKREMKRWPLQVSAPPVTRARAHLIGNERLRSPAPPLMKFG